MVVIVHFWACRQTTTHPANTHTHTTLSYQQQRLARYLGTVWPAARQQVQNADLVIRLGADMTSEMLRQLNLQNASFSHCGIASIENDTVFIYHAIGGEFNPTQKLKREPLYNFGHPTENKAIAIYRPLANPAQRLQIIAGARQAHQAGLPFDMDFNYQSNDQQYCAEFVAKCLVKALNDSSWLQFTKVGSFEYVAVDNLFLSTIMTPVATWHY
ncbi:MAG TPA: YiiX/YebB-like N1pC/P60 family cysteine hydrolase [Phnomibacter sp.]|nr:YiiX/YebB-like N1pC/P60 family cysteine hydrolase [Phnomibacter sp.]